MIAVQALEKQNETIERRIEEIDELKAQIAELREMIAIPVTARKRVP